MVFGRGGVFAEKKNYSSDHWNHSPFGCMVLIFFSISEDLRIAFGVCERKKEDQVGFECISNTQ